MASNQRAQTLYCGRVPTQIWVVLLICRAGRQGNLLQPIKNTTHIRVMTRHKYRVCARLLRRHFARKPMVAWRGVGSFDRVNHT